MPRLGRINWSTSSTTRSSALSAGWTITSRRSAAASRAERLGGQSLELERLITEGVALIERHDCL
jgi:hypothetical protein